MVGESVPPKREKDLTPPPTRLVGGRRVQYDGHEGPDVVQPGGMSVESDDVVSVKSRGEGASGLTGGASWATGGWLRMGATWWPSRQLGRCPWHARATGQGPRRARAPVRQPRWHGWWR
jgi:hypothetical protein